MAHYYVLISESGVGTKEGAFFESQGGLIEKWGKAWERIGYLEEALRHIRDVAEKRGFSIVRAQVPKLALSALQAGDPLTCPEARKAT